MFIVSLVNFFVKKISVKKCDLKMIHGKQFEIDDE